MGRTRRVHDTGWRARAAAAGVLAVTLVAVVGVGTPVAAAGATIAVSPSTVAAGGSVTFTGSIPTTGDGSCPASEGVTLTSSQALFPQGGFGPTVARSAAGDFTTSYQVPTSTPAGSYTVGMRCGGGNVGVTTVLAVTSTAARPVSGQPGFTG
jgi:hypothetical protein